MSLGSSEGIPAVMNVTPTGGYANGGCNNGWGGDGAIWLIILFLIWGNGGWGNGFGGGWGGGNNAGFQGALTRGDLCMDMNFNDVQNGVRNVNDAVNTGFANLNSTICHQQYDTAQLVNGINNNLSNGFAGLNNAVCTLGYQNAQLINGLDNTIQQGFSGANVVALQNQNALQTQLSGCCCDLRAGQAQTQNAIERGFCQTNYNDATNTNAIIQNGHNDTDRVLAKLDAMEMARKDETIAALREKLSTANLAASQSAQNAYLVDQLRPCPQPAYLTCNPFTGQTYAYGQYSNGCGCNSGCCGCNG